MLLASFVHWLHYGDDDDDAGNDDGFEPEIEIEWIGETREQRKKNGKNGMKKKKKKMS